MGRDTKRYAYLTIRFDRTSKLWQHLSKDAEDIGQPITDIIPVRLADSYAGRVPGTLLTQDEPIIPHASTHMIEDNANVAASHWREEE